MKPLHPAYVAGILDGEGTIGTHACARGAGDNWSVRVVVAMTHRELLRALQQQYGGSLTEDKVRPGRKPFHRWQLHGAQVMPLLLDVEPYMLVKRKQVQLAIEFRSETMPRGPRSVGNEQRRTEVRERRRVLRARISELNQGLAPA